MLGPPWWRSSALKARFVLQRQLESRQSTVRVHDAMVGFIKCVLASERGRVAESLDRPLSRATAPGVVKALQSQILRYDAYLAHEPLASARASAAATPIGSAATST
jgi:hypothetical protein